MSERVRGETLETGSYAGTGGRPGQYDPSICDKLLEWGAQGKSRTWMAAELGIHRDTLYAWEKEYPEFSDALKRAKALEQQWWEDAGQTGMYATVFSGSIWGRSMAARFPDDWREVSRREETGPNGGPIEKHVTTIERVIVDKGNESPDPDA